MMASDCIFCKIISGEIPNKPMYQDEEVIAFPDIHPVAPVHILILPRKHIPSLAEMNEQDASLAGKMILVANRLAREHNVSETGYRLVINSGTDAGQVVQHLHIHLIGGRAMGPLA